MDLVRLRFDGVFSLVRESNVRTDWSVFWFRSALQADVIVSTAFQSSTLSSVSARLWSGAGGPVLVRFEWW